MRWGRPRPLRARRSRLRVGPRVSPPRLSLLVVAGLASRRCRPPRVRPPREQCIVARGLLGGARSASSRRLEARGKDDGRGVYTVAEEGGRRFLRAASQGHRNPGRAGDHRGTSHAYPVLAWSWRPVEFPDGRGRAQVEDERQRAGRVRACFPHSPVSVKIGEVHLERGGARRHAPHLEHGPHPGARAPDRRPRARASGWTSA